MALEVAKVRCRTCYHDHDYRNEEAPPSKKDLKKAELFKEVLAAAVPGAADEVAIELETETTVEAPLDADADAEPEAEPVPSERPKKSKARTKKA